LLLLLFTVYWMIDGNDEVTWKTKWLWLKEYMSDDLNFWLQIKLQFKFWLLTYNIEIFHNIIFFFNRDNTLTRLFD